MKTSKSTIFVSKKHSPSRSLLKFRRSKSDRTLNNLVSANDEFERREPRRQSLGGENYGSKIGQKFYNHNYQLKAQPVLATKKASPLNKIGKKIKKKLGLKKRTKSTTPLFIRNISNKSIEFWEEDIPRDEIPSFSVE